MKHVLFDLDGTLLPMDQDVFVGYYFPLLAKRLKPYGFDQDTVIQAVWTGVKAMVINDGSISNEEAFWNCFEQLVKIERQELEPLILDFYANEFNEAIRSTDPSPLSAKIVQAFKERGDKVYLATNPIFPRCATMNRIRWAGLNAEDFELITTYENCRYSKPNVLYYQDILEEFHLEPEDCLMIGNDAEEDLAIRKLGVKTYLVTDCLENKKGLPLESEYKGSLEELYEYVKSSRL